MRMHRILGSIGAKSMSARLRLLLTMPIVACLGVHRERGILAVSRRCLAQLAMRNVHRAVFFWMGNETGGESQVSMKNIHVSNVVAESQYGCFIGSVTDKQYERQGIPWNASKPKTSHNAPAPANPARVEGFVVSASAII